MSKKLFRSIFIACCLYAANSGAQIITTIAGDGVRGYAGDGTIASFGRFADPRAILVDDSGNVFIADQDNYCVRKIDIYGYLSTVAGQQGKGGSTGDGGPAKAAKLSYPRGLALDKKGNLYISDSRNHKIRKVSTDGKISTFAGAGSPGYNGDSVSALTARLNEPAGLVFDKYGNLYIADELNDRIRMVDTNGIMYSIAGNGLASYSGDNDTAKKASINRPTAVAVADNGEIYISDTYNNRIRKIDSNGIITTVVGSGKLGFGGDEGRADSAQLSRPSAITFDRKGNLYIADMNNNRVRMVDGSNKITTIVGDGRPVSSGDGGNSADAAIVLPAGIALDTNSNIYIAEASNNIRFVYTGAINEEPMTIFPNPGKGQTSVILASSYEEIATITIVNTLGQRMFNVEAPTNRFVAIKFDRPGTYYLTANSKHKKWHGTLVVLP